VRDCVAISDMPSATCHLPTGSVSRSGGGGRGCFGIQSKISRTCTTPGIAGAMGGSKEDRYFHARTPMYVSIRRPLERWRADTCSRSYPLLPRTRESRGAMQVTMRDQAAQSVVSSLSGFRPGSTAGCPRPLSASWARSFKIAVIGEEVWW